MGLSKLFILPILAIVGTVLGWAVTDLFIIEISLLKYFLIEVIVSSTHYLYNQSKK
jgi:cation transporter-like permease